MTTEPLRITVHMASSLDGIIAKKDNSTDWFETDGRYEKGVSISEEESKVFLDAIDCYVMGANTYTHALELSKTYGWPYGEKPTVVVTHRNLPVQNPNVSFYSGDLHRLVHERLEPGYRRVWLAGGASLSREFIRLKLAHEIRLSIIPVLLGEGLRFFEYLPEAQQLTLKNSTAYKNGIVDLHYEIRK